MLRRLLRTDRKTTRARVLARLAGVPAGLRQTRRGSFLILVVGTLALLSVITIIYVSIGRSDRQTSAAVLKFDQRKDAPAAIRDYLAGVIADDLFDHLYLGERDENNIPIYRREAWDYPSAAATTLRPRPKALNNPDQTLPVTVGGADPKRPGEFGFYPTGNGTGTDPWLASPEPVLLDFEYASGYSGNPTLYFLERLDWMNLSNFAPDGSFVNLYNLRGETKNGVSTGNFDATPWEMRGRNLDDKSPEAKLTLFADTPEDDGARNGALDYGGQPIDPSDADAVPAQFGSRQRWAVWPAIEPRSNRGIRPEDPDYLLYQYADADGDGILDARWIELVEDRDPTDGLATYFLEPDDRFRYFIAVRAIDLSGRVNVNTATDSSLAPAFEDPFGLTPSAIDIRRLLDGEDFFTDQRLVVPGSGSPFGMGYRDSIQPNHPKNPDDADPSNYEGYYTDLNSASDFRGYMVGEKAYDAIRTVLDTGIMPGAGYDGLLLLANGGSVNREFSMDSGGTINMYWSPYWKTGNEFAPTDYYAIFAGYGPDGAGLASGGSITSGVGRPFGYDSLFELLAYNGVNDDRTRSPLETVLGGRADPVANGFSVVYPAERYSPLRDSRRTADVERLRGGWTGRGYEFYDEAKAALYTDIRQRLTTVSIARPITAEQLPADTANPDRPLQTELKLVDPRSARTPIKDLCSSATELFSFYADALAPYSRHQTGPLGDHWDPGDSNFDEYRTLSYGYSGPHLAIRTAAHLAVNMRDAYDGGAGPSKRTVLLNGSQSFRDRESLYTVDNRPRDPMYPWRLLDLDGLSKDGPYPDSPRLYGADPMPDPASMPDAINVFGVEAQPFLVEAASFVMYTDTPHDLGGDEDYPLYGANGLPIGRKNYRPSINGRVPDMGITQDNPDFLFEVLAFQVHNPFDETITLSGAGGNIAEAQQDLYYIQYGDQYFKLTDVTTGSEQAITIGPRDSKTLYVLSQHPDIVARRINRVTKDTAYGTKTLDEEKARIKDWIDRQVGPDAIQIAPFEPTTGTVTIPPDRVLDLRQVADLQQGDRESRRAVKLWRVEKPALDLENGGIDIRGVDESLTNEPANDTLVDRMRDSGLPSEPPTLDRRLWEPTDGTDAQKDQDGAISGPIKQAPEPPDPRAAGKDNRGLTITRYSLLRRNGDTQAGQATTPPRGGIPAYCLELKEQFEIDGITPLDAANDTQDDGSPSKQLRYEDVDSGKEADDTLDDLLGKQSSSGNLTNRLVPTISIKPERKEDDAHLGISIQDIPANEAGVAFNDLRVEIHLNNDLFEDANGLSVMRVADLLLPLGIGPYQIPDPAFNGGDEDVEWTTLGEALATALYYENDTRASNAYANAFVPPPAPTDPDRVLFDRAMLRYDWFVPFVDSNEDGLFTAGEPTWGLGVPLAATIFDKVSTLEEKFASLAAPTHGVMNINTASRETLRSLPALSPPQNTNPGDLSGNWWWNDGTHDWRSDIATMLAAYRDRTYLYPRDVTGAEPSTEPIDFRSWWDIAAGTRINPSGSVPPGDDPGDNARWGTTGVAGIREQPGIRSLGEITFLRDWGYPTDPNPGYLYPHDIDRLGYDTDNIQADGVDSLAYDFDGDNNKTDDDEITDDYDERLALASAVMSSASVRSDIFAVWFLVHGYQESDVKGLAPQDPMVPSLARRFVMVVDRSNVTKPGDKPRIVLFKEVPL
jgi:hypothetical protein